MPSLRHVFLFFFSISAFCAGARGQDKEVNFPTDDEIRLLLTQAERAIGQYKLLLDQEQMMLGEKGSEAVAKDRQVVENIEIAIKAFRKNPQGFNGPLGFAFFEWLDDADRNALLCATTSLNDSTTSMLTGDKDGAQAGLHLAQGCMDASALIYTVSENAGALYARYVEGEEKLAKEGLRVAEKCAAVLKQKGIVPKQ